MALPERALRIPESIASELARVLEDAIIYGEIEPGTRLREEEVSVRYGVSRSPVREAFRLLERDGLAIRATRRGFKVSEVGRRDLREVYSCRVALEGLAAEQAAAARTQAQVAAMRRLLADMGAAKAARDARAYFAHNVALTGLIYEATGNETLQRLLSRIEKQARRYRFMAYVTRPALIAQSETGNRRIIDAIADGKPETARDITEGLIRTSWKAIDAHLESAGFDE
ncbi:MAG: GntR family transcriptional regulator [Alphaproteobacteria bacterium]|nr:GntR family transcriptional regulator [Alphaproteobacteria bacterium]